MEGQTHLRLGEFEPGQLGRSRGGAGATEEQKYQPTSNSTSKLAHSKRFAWHAVEGEAARASVWSAGACSRFWKGAQSHGTSGNRRTCPRHIQQRQQAGALQTLRVARGRG